MHIKYIANSLYSYKSIFLYSMCCILDHISLRSNLLSHILKFMILDNLFIILDKLVLITDHIG